MLKVIGILLIAAVILWMEVPPLLEKKDKKELVVFSIFLVIGLGLSIAQGLGKPIPNPLDLLTLVFKPIHDVLVR
ncbi:hypothetical protein ACN6MT_05800 [Neobacillus niacini]|uniref:hypothetical protein n=1 Tax=Neobacillus niacini TaxID=86668 RepID=UPI003B02137D